MGHHEKKPKNESNIAMREKQGHWNDPVCAICMRHYFGDFQLDQAMSFDYGCLGHVKRDVHNSTRKQGLSDLLLAQCLSDVECGSLKEKLCFWNSTRRFFDGSSATSSVVGSVWSARAPQSRGR